MTRRTKFHKRQTILISAGKKIIHQSHNRAVAAQFQQRFGEGTEALVVIDPDEIFGREAWLVTVGDEERFISFRRKDAESYAAQHDDCAKQCYGVLSVVTKRRLYLASDRKVDLDAFVPDELDDENAEPDFLPDDDAGDTEGGVE